MITFIAHLHVKPENAPAFERLMTRVVEETRRHEEGVVHYACSKSADEPDTYVVVEVYRDAQVHADHMARPWVTESLPRCASLIEGKPRIRQYVSDGSRPIARTVASD